MARRRQHAPLRVYLNNRLIGHLLKDAAGAISFGYDPAWLGWNNAIPVSLSLPLREDVYRGAPVAAVFENLLPDSEALRRRVAERIGAEGADAYSLLAAIGRDCVGALQFIAGDHDVTRSPPPRSRRRSRWRRECRRSDEHPDRPNRHRCRPMYTTFHCGRRAPPHRQARR